MNHTTKSKKRWNHTQPTQAAARASPTSWKRLAALGLCLLLAAGGTWAFMEFVVWNKLPAELVGKWTVRGGEQDGATFDFYRNGSAVGHVNIRDNLELMYAQVRVDGDSLFMTTQNPVTGAALTVEHKIETLNATQLVLQDVKGNRFRMERAAD